MLAVQRKGPVRRRPSILTLTCLPLALAPAAVGELARRVEPLGYNGVKMGMTVAQASAVFGPLRIDPNSTPDDTGSCTYAFPVGRRSPAFMVIDGRIERVDVSTRAIPSRNGILVGDPAARVFARFGRSNVAVSKHKYDPRGTYIEVKPVLPAERGHRLLFETSRGRVTQFRAGRIPAVWFVEGCA